MQNLLNMPKTEVQIGTTLLQVKKFTFSTSNFFMQILTDKKHQTDLW